MFVIKFHLFTSFFFFQVYLAEWIEENQKGGEILNEEDSKIKKSCLHLGIIQCICDE